MTEDDFQAETPDEADEFASEELPPTDDVEVELDPDEYDPEGEAEEAPGETSTGAYGESEQPEDMPESDQSDG